VTAAALRERGVEPALVAEQPSQEGVVAALREATDGEPGRVLFAGAEDARDVVARELGADVAVLYRTVEETPPDFPHADLVVLASGSAARAYARLGGAAACVSIGPQTSREAERLGLRVLAEAERPDAESLAAAFSVAASRLRPSSPS
jgi:uroporphyrinogen-III synthase